MSMTRIDSRDEWSAETTGREASYRRKVIELIDWYIKLVTFVDTSFTIVVPDNGLSL